MPPAKLANDAMITRGQTAPSLGHSGQAGLFVAIFCVILSMYGGGFATVPAYLSDMFGTQFVGAIHGRLLTAWSTAGVIGPLLIDYIRDAQIAADVPKAQVYDRTMYILVALLLIGLICNLLVKPVASKYFMIDAQIAEARLKAHETAVPATSSNSAAGGFSFAVLLAWLVVGIPIAWGAWMTLQKAAVLF